MAAVSIKGLTSLSETITSSAQSTSQQLQITLKSTGDDATLYKSTLQTRLIN